MRKTQLALALIAGAEIATAAVAAREGDRFGAGCGLAAAIVCSAAAAALGRRRG